jgi:hypothetical protein
MAGSLQKKRADVISAALRHVRDAETLYADGPRRSIDQAFHLAGFAPECARKACLFERFADKAIGHGFDENTEAIIETALCVDPRAHRYRPLGWSMRFPVFADWTPVSRYWPTNQADESRTRQLIQDARTVVGEVVLAMWADGALPARALSVEGDDDGSF